MNDTSTPVHSIDDIIETTRQYLNDNSEEISDVILYFVSELTGLSVDKILELL